MLQTSQQNSDIYHYKAISQQEATMHIELDDTSFQSHAALMPKMHYVKKHGRWVCSATGIQIKIVLETLAIRVEVKDTVNLTIYNHSQVSKAGAREVRISYNGTTGGIYSIQSYDPETELVTSLDEFSISPFHSMASCIQYESQ